MAAARVSLTGATVGRTRYPRWFSGAPATSSESESRVPAKWATTRTSGRRVSTSGRPPRRSRRRSTSASLIFRATNPEWVCSESRRVASTAKVAPGSRWSSQGTSWAASYRPSAPWTSTSASGQSSRMAMRDQRAIRSASFRLAWKRTPPRSARTRAAPSSVSSSARRSSVPRAAVAKSGTRLGIGGRPLLSSPGSLQAWLTAARRQPRREPMRRTVLLLVVWAVPLVAWASDGGAKAGIDAGNRKFEAAVAKGDASAIAKLYAVDAMILPPNAPPAKGREAIEKEFAGMLGAGFKKIVLTTEEVFPQGNFATEVG